MRRTAESIEEAKEARRDGKSKAKRKHESFKTEESQRKRRRGTHPNSLKNLRLFQPGQSGNPGGRPKNDIAREIAQAVFEGNPDAVRNAFDKALRKGNAYVFKELADRAYGKVTDKLEVGGDEALIQALMLGRKRIANDDDASR